MDNASTPVSRGRILVVGDQHMMRTVTALKLRAEGYAVIEAASGEEALAMLARSGVELLLTDLMKPKDGLTLLRRALEVAPHVLVITLLASGSSIESAVESMRLGAFDFIQKPLVEGELSHRVERAMRSRLIS
ncbi:response regulator [Archangium gephyra]